MAVPVQRGGLALAAARAQLQVELVVAHAQLEQELEVAHAQLQLELEECAKPFAPKAAAASVLHLSATVARASPGARQASRG